jgi:hypothetical protein
MVWRLQTGNPWYIAFDREYGQQGLAVIGVAIDDEGWVKVRPYPAQPKDMETGGNTAMQYPVILGNPSLSKAYGLTSMPMTVLIDREGKIAVSHIGVVHKESFEHNSNNCLTSDEELIQSTFTCAGAESHV